MVQVLAAKLFSIKLCYLAALTWHLYRLLIDGRSSITVDNSQQVSMHSIQSHDSRCKSSFLSDENADHI